MAEYVLLVKMVSLGAEAVIVFPGVVSRVLAGASGNFACIKSQP